MGGQLVELLDRAAAVERVDHVGPGRLVEGLDQLLEPRRMLAREVDALGEIVGVVVQRPVVEIDG